jgi:hypothetical protein
MAKKRRLLKIRQIHYRPVYNRAATLSGESLAEVQPRNRYIDRLFLLFFMSHRKANYLFCMYVEAHAHSGEVPVTGLSNIMQHDAGPSLAKVLTPALPSVSLFSIV